MRRLILAVSMMMFAGACGGEETNNAAANNGGDCPDGQAANPVTGDCEAENSTPATDAGMNDSTGGDDGGNNTGTGDDTGNNAATGDDMGNGGTPDEGMVEPDGSNGGMDMPPTGDWPPAIESLYMPGMCIVPACDDQGDPGFDPSGDWIQTLTTTDSDCSEFIMGQDARANPGNVEESEPGPLDTYSGQCANDGGEHVGTAKDGILASCDRNEQDFGVVSYETSVVEFSGDTGTGVAFVYLENVPSFVGEDCFMKFDVDYQRQ